MLSVTAVMRSRVVLAAVSCGACVVSCSIGEDCNHSCPIGSFAVTVPVDRLSDVASVEVTGPCSPDNTVSGFPPQVFFFRVSGEGVCQVTVSFRSGVPDLVKDVPLAKARGGGCRSVVYAQGDVSVAESAPV